jgi:hypothetical protein
LRMRLPLRADKIALLLSAHGGVIRVCLKSLCRQNTNIMTVANVNGTVYIYGGQATTQSGQTANTWSK